MRKIPIFFSTDDSYVSLMATAMTSILCNTKSFIEFYILDCGISEKNKIKLQKLSEKFDNFSIEFLEVKITEKFGDITLHKHPSYAAFARFLIPTLKPELNKIIYLDCDTITMKDISELYDVDLNGKIVGFVPDPLVAEKLDKRAKRFESAQLSNNHIYFNSGVMLLDCNLWRKNNMFEKIMLSEKQTAETRMFNDQDILNNAFDSNYQTIDIKFNVKSDVLEYCNQSDIVIRHFTGWIKPWLKSGFIQANATDFWYYAQKTEFFAEMLISGIAEVGVITIGNVRKI